MPGEFLAPALTSSNAKSERGFMWLRQRRDGALHAAPAHGGMRQNASSISE
jgi:hypothetical protein